MKTTLNEEAVTLVQRVQVTYANIPHTHSRAKKCIISNMKCPVINQYFS